MSTSLTLTLPQYETLKSHLFPGDGLEAVAFLLCGQARGSNRTRLVVRKVVLLPHDRCSVRAPDQVTWPTEWLVPALNEAASKGWSVFKIHGHANYPRFSEVDDRSDRELFPSVHAWVGSDVPHGSAILLDSGEILGRTVGDEGHFSALHCVSLTGPDPKFWHADTHGDGPAPAFGMRIQQTFGKGTYSLLRQLRVGVIGCSGTGSPLIEQLARNCVGELVLVDPDVIEEKNLNRIYNSTWEDAISGTRKVEVAARAIRAMGLGTQVTPIATSLFDPLAVRQIAACDIVFGCVDSVDGRHLLNRLAVFYSLPYLDVGVKLEADGKGGVDQVCGSVHYLLPYGSSLLSRKVFTLEQVRAAGLRRTDPAAYEALRKEGYIHGGNEDRPAVIQLNSFIASVAVNELLARLHPYRLDANEDYAIQRFSLSHGIFDREGQGVPCEVLSRHVGRGDTVPLLDLPELSER